MAGKSGRTAMARRKASAPLRWLLEKFPECIAGRVLDLGCGKGADVEHLEDLGVPVQGWDPNHRPDSEALEAGPYGTVLCTFVANVLDRRERRDLLDQILGLLDDGGEAYVTVRRDVPKEGTWSSLGTWQESPDLEDEWAGPEVAVEVIRDVSGWAMYRVGRPGAAETLPAGANGRQYLLGL